MHQADRSLTLLYGMYIVLPPFCVYKVQALDCRICALFAPRHLLHSRHLMLLPSSEDDVKKEIAAQDPGEACGGDGIHMPHPPSSPALVVSSYSMPLVQPASRTGTTPRAWNLTDIHLLTKDVNKSRDVDNVRPITLIGMHRKIFERLVLVHHFDRAGWAKLHPTQADFRGDYSMLTNAALVHHLLASRSVQYAAFVDLEKAFDIVDHSRLAALLLDRVSCIHLLHHSQLDL